MLLVRLGGAFRSGRIKIPVGYGIYLDEFLNLYIPDGYCYNDEETGLLYRVGDLYISHDEDNNNRIYRVGDIYIDYDDDEGGRAYKVGSVYISYDDEEGGRPYKIGENYLYYSDDGYLYKVGDTYL